VVQQAAGDRLTISTAAGPKEFRVAQDTTVEALRPVAPAQLVPGDWLNAGAVSHNQTIFALVGVTVIPRDQVQAPSP
jgi:hypothetical protein